MGQVLEPVSRGDSWAPAQVLMNYRAKIVAALPLGLSLAEIIFPFDAHI